MSAQTFWVIVSRAKMRAGDQLFARISTLHDELKILSNEDLLAFHQQFLDAHLRAYKHDLAAAADLAIGGLTDDSFEYFRNWLISEGEATFNAVVANPDELAGFSLRGICGQLESYGYVAASLLTQRGLAYELPCTGAELPGNPIDVSEYGARFPRLSSKFRV